MLDVIVIHHHRDTGMQPEPHVKIHHKAFQRRLAWLKWVARGGRVTITNTDACSKKTSTDVQHHVVIPFIIWTCSAGT